MGHRAQAVVALAGIALALSPVAARAQQPDPPLVGAKYVAMGSSFASGPNITTPADMPPTRCARSQDNYAHQLARRFSLALTDVSCSGATTAHLLGPWNELPAQLDAVDAQTRLVTITIGGNDVNYSRGLSAMGCVTAAAAQGAAPARCSQAPAAPTDQDFILLEQHLRQIAQEVRRRAPMARLVFIDYPTVLPPKGACAALSLTAEQAGLSRQINRRVVAITKQVARQTGSGLIAASALSAKHNACSGAPWTNGYPVPQATGDGIAFHPRLASHTAIAQALGRLISR